MKQKVNIIIIGLANSGSSAVQDLLSEYRSVGRFRYEEPNLITGELNHFRLRGMIADQLYPDINVSEQFILPKVFKKLKRPSIPLAALIRPFISNNMYSLMRPEGFTKDFAQERIQQIKKQQKYYDLTKATSQQLLKEGDYKKRISITKAWLAGVNDIFAYQKPFIIHKPIFHESHLDIWPEIFEPFKVIVIIRDPKDQMSTMLSTSPIFNDLPWRFDALFGRDKESGRAFAAFIQTTLMRMRKISEMEMLFVPDNFLMLDFEGLVSNYDIYKDRIESFLGLNSGDHITKFKFFNPEISRQTINKYLGSLTPLEEQIIEPLYEWHEKSMTKIRKSLC